MDLIISSLTLQPNLFQLFQPIGGVSATPLSQPRAAGTKISMGVKDKRSTILSNLHFMCVSWKFRQGIIKRVQDLAERYKITRTFSKVTRPPPIISSSRGKIASIFSV